MHGDFEVTASFEILKAEKPLEGGGVGPELYLRTIDGWSTFVAMTRMLRVDDDEPELTAVWGERIDGQPRYHLKHEKTDLKACRFRIARAGPTVRYLVAPKDSDSFREVSRNEFGTKDLDMVRIMGQVHGSSALDVLWKDLTIRAEALPGLAGVKSTGEGRSTSSWIIVSGLAGAGAAALGAWLWWNGAARRQGGITSKGPRGDHNHAQSRSRRDRGLASVGMVRLAGASGRVAGSSPRTRWTGTLSTSPRLPARPPRPSRGRSRPAS